MERPPLLITFDTFFEQKIDPTYAPIGPTLEFEITGDRTNFVDSRNLYLEVKRPITKPECTNLDYHATDATKTDMPMFANNALHSLYFDCTITAKGIKICSANGNYAQTAFLATEFSTNKEAKDTWLKCQGYNFESNPGILPHKR